MRLEVVLAADAGVGHHRGARAGLDRGVGDVAAAGAEGAVEGVVAAELVADLVGDVVDGEEVALGLGEAGAAAALVVAADDAEVGDAATVHAERDVADVVVGGADQLTEDGAVLAEGRAAAEVEVAEGVVTLVGRPVVVVRVEARGRAARAVGAGRLRVGVEVERVGVVDQAQLDGEVVVVDLVDPVDQGDLLGQHVLAAEVGGVGRVGGQREAVVAPVRRHVGDAVGGPGLGDGLAQGLDLTLGTTLGRRREVGRAVAQVGGGAAAVEGRVDVPVGLGAGLAHEGVEAHRRDVERDRGLRVVDAHAGPGLDLGVRRGELRLHGLGPLDAEGLQRAVRAGDLDDGGGVAAGEVGAEGGEVDAGGGVLLGLHADLVARERESAERGERRVVGCGGGGSDRAQRTCSHDEGDTDGQGAEPS